MIPQPLTEQELHNLAMNIVGEDLQSQGFEFLAINSTLKKNPQFVALKDKIVYFVIVRAVLYPNKASNYDLVFMQTMKAHAAKFEAKTCYAGVGLGHGSDFKKPAIKNEPYGLVYQSIQEIL